MALIKCKHCGNLISDKATKCPKCGCPTTKRSEPHIPQETPQVQPVYYEDEKGGRFRKWLYGIIALLVALIAGGGYWWYSRSGDEREVKQFVEKFAKAVELGDKQTIRRLYPKSDGAESLHVSYYVDSMSIVHPTGNDTIDVKLSHSQSIRLTKDAKKQMYIVSSKGLFDFPKEEIDFAIKTGWINSSLDDAVKAERLKDKEFIPWLVKDFASRFKGRLRVKGSVQTTGNPVYFTDEYAMCSVNVENRTNHTISGNDYNVIFKGVFAWQGIYEDDERVESGKTISPGESLLFTIPLSISHSYDNAYVKFKLNNQDIFDKYFTAEGNEYENYLKSRN